MSEILIYAYYLKIHFNEFWCMEKFFDIVKKFFLEIKHQILKALFILHLYAWYLLSVKNCKIKCREICTE